MSFEDSQEQMLHSILHKSYEIDEKSKFDDSEHNSDIADDLQQPFYLVDEEDRDIIMHRDVHFGGNFTLMLDAYKDELRSAVLDTSTKRIQSLTLQEVALKQNIAPLLLTGADAEKIAIARKMYRNLQDICQENKPTTIAEAIAEFILAEKDPVEETEKVVSFGEKAVPYLIDIIQSPYFRDPIFPGYGLAPIAAADALGTLKATAAIPALFDMIGDLSSNNTFDFEQAAISALLAIGDPAKDFLIKRLKSQPVNHSNTQAAIALLAFDIPDEMQQEIENLLPWPC